MCVPKMRVQLRHALARADVERLRRERTGRRGSVRLRTPEDHTGGLQGRRTTAASAVRLSSRGLALSE